MSLDPLPIETLAYIVSLASAAGGVRTLAALCRTNRTLYRVCQIPFLQRNLLDLPLMSFLPNSGGNLVSHLEMLCAAGHLRRTRTCTRYALYSALVIATRRDWFIGIRSCLLSLDAFVQQDSRPPDNHLFAAIHKGVPRSRLWIRVRASGLYATFLHEPSQVMHVPDAAPDESVRALVNRALCQTAADAAVETHSRGPPRDLIDLFRAYPQLLVKATEPDYGLDPESSADGVRQHIVVDLSPIFDSCMLLAHIKS